MVIENKIKFCIQKGVDEDSEADQANGTAPASEKGGQLSAIVKKKPGFKGMHKTFGQKFRQVKQLIHTLLVSVADVCFYVFLQSKTKVMFKSCFMEQNFHIPRGIV